MKKIKLMIFFMSLVLGIFFFIPIKISAITSDGNATDWYNYITQFEDGFATASVDSIYVDYPSGPQWFTILIKQSPDNEFDGYYIQYDFLAEEHYVYSEEVLGDAFNYWWLAEMFSQDISFDIAFYEYSEIYELDIEYNGIIYWNFEEEYWQIEPYGEEPYDEPDYFEQLYVKLVPAVITVITLASILSMLVFKKRNKQ